MNASEDVPGKFRGRAMVVLSIIGLVVGAAMWTVVVTASVTNVHVPGTVNIVILASVTSSHFTSADTLLLRVHLDVTSHYPTGVVKTLTAKVAAYSSENIATAAKFTSFSLHKLTISGGQTVGVDKQVVVHNATIAAADASAFIVATAIELGDGTASTFISAATINTACFISQLTATADLGCKVTVLH